MRLMQILRSENPIWDLDVLDAFLQQVFAGIATGVLYGGIGLAFVMVYQSTHHINFAQGEMATFTTFLAWGLIEAGASYWLAFFAAAVVGFAQGVLVDIMLMRRLSSAPPISTVIVTIGLLMLFNSASGYFFDYSSRAFPSPFDAILPGTVVMSPHEIGTCLVVLAVVVLLYAMFRFTWFGLAMRGAVSNASSATLVGISVDWVRSAGWGLSGAIGSIVGMMVAPIVFLEPNMMIGVVVYGFAAALLGGLDNPWGAVAGGVVVGVLENLLGAYLIGNDLKLTVALAVVLLVLYLRPQGFLGRRLVRRQ